MLVKSRVGVSGDESRRCVMIGDIRRSSRIADWPATFRQLQRTLRQMNRAFARVILIPFRPTVGDEFQGALRAPDSAYDVLMCLKTGFHHSFCVGMGLGEVERPFRADTGMRGTAFYRARRAIETCKRTRQGALLFSDDKPTEADQLVNLLLSLQGAIEARWTAREREIVDYARLHPDNSHERLARHFGISRQAITKSLGSAGWDAIHEAELHLRGLMATANGCFPKSNHQRLPTGSPAPEVDSGKSTPGG